MLKYLFLVGVPLVLLQSCTQADSHVSPPDYAMLTVERPKSAAELRAELLARERESPETYLTVEGTSRRNLINQLVLEGDIANQATLARFKDPVLRVLLNK